MKFISFFIYIYIYKLCLFSRQHSIYCTRAHLRYKSYKTSSEEVCIIPRRPGARGTRGGGEAASSHRYLPKLMHFLPFFPSKHHRGDTISTIGPRSPAPGVQVPHSSVPVTTNQGCLRQLERFPISSPALLFFLVYQLRWSCHSNSKKSLISSLNWSKNPKQVKKKAFKLPKKHEQYKAPASASPRGSPCHLKHNKGTRGKGFFAG